MTQNMKVSLRGRIELMSHEGIVTSRYKDSVGVWTIGVGVTDAAGASIKPSQFTGTITLKQAVEMFENVLRKYERGVNRAIKVPLEQHEFDALVSFHYNTGGISRASATKHINAGNKAKGARALLAWKKPPEIIGRRKAEVALFLHGKYGNGKANVYPASKSGRVQWGKGKRRDLTSMLKAPSNTPTPKPRPKKPNTVNMLKVGDKGPLVEKWQTTLNDIGFPVHVDGIYGNATKEQTSKFQHQCNLKIDGVAGPDTMTAAQAVLAAQLAHEKQQAEMARIESVESGENVDILKEVAEDAAANNRWSADKLVAGGGVIATITATVKEVSENVGGIVADFAGMLPDWFIPAALIAAGGGFGFHWYSRNKKKKHAQAKLDKVR